MGLILIGDFLSFIGNRSAKDDVLVIPMQDRKQRNTTDIFSDDVEHNKINRL